MARLQRLYIASRRGVPCPEYDAADTEEPHEGELEPRVVSRPDAVRRAIGSLYARYKWWRLRQVWRAVGAVLAAYVEVSLRPGHTRYLAAKASFDACVGGA
jgi:hypothetical protein